MKKISLLLLILPLYFISFGQSIIKFDERSIKISKEVAQEAAELYSETNYGNELIISVLTKKELKKLPNKDKINKLLSLKNSNADNNIHKLKKINE